MNASMRRGSPRRMALAATAAAALLSLGLAGCGGSGDHRAVVLPPGGVAVGNVVCSSSAEPPTNAVAQGQAINLRFTLTDVNIHLPISAPISFDVVGGTVLNPPTSTDANGVALVTFLASDPTLSGSSRPTRAWTATSASRSTSPRARCAPRSSTASATRSRPPTRAAPPRATSSGSSCAASSTTSRASTR
jgi:hypothetical protein